MWLTRLTWERWRRSAGLLVWKWSATEEKAANDVDRHVSGYTSGSRPNGQSTEPEGKAAKLGFRPSLLQLDAAPAHTSPPPLSMGKTSRFRGVSFCRRTKRFKAVGSI
jgi:hypothetical protein